MGELARAAVVPLTPEELQQAEQLLAEHGVCVANLQRRMRIGWNRAADLIERLRGHDALPPVAQHRYGSAS